MTGLGLVMLGLAIALLVMRALRGHCEFCLRPMTGLVRKYGGKKGMLGRFCGECRPMVQAIDARAVVEAVERECSSRFDLMAAGRAA